jgi:DNA-binding transcriptional MerR regulator
LDIYNDVSYVSVPDDNECIVNAVQIGKIIDEPPHTIRSWANEYEEFLWVKKINGRLTYTKESIDEFRWIKSMRDSGMGRELIRQQFILKKKGINEIEKVADPNNIGFMESIKNDLKIEMDNRIKDFLTEFIRLQADENFKLVNSIKTEVEQTVQEQLETSMSDIKQELQESKELNAKLSVKLEEIQNEIAITRENAEKIDDLRVKLEDRKKEFEQTQNNKQSIWNKIFKK